MHRIECGRGGGFFERRKRRERRVQERRGVLHPSFMCPFYYHIEGQIALISVRLVAVVVPPFLYSFLFAPFNTLTLNPSYKVSVAVVLEVRRHSIQKTKTINIIVKHGSERSSSTSLSELSVHPWNAQPLSPMALITVNWTHKKIKEVTMEFLKTTYIGL